MRPRALVVGVSFVALTVAGACDRGGTSGTASPAPPTSGIDGDAPQHGAPLVANPLNTAQVEAAPCDFVPKEQLEAVGLQVESLRSDSAAQRSTTCDIFLDRTSSISAGLNSEDFAGGLDTLYEKHAQGKIPLFTPVPEIAGYPAVVYRTTAPKSDGRCSLAVGVRNDQQYLFIGIIDPGSPHYANPCGAVTKVAELAVQRLKEVQ
ncbi:DUF3558 domain-containing protein [Amycolatopsis arida]|nr:DUF3558 domain-containing protein [Amycolatopsis arida]